MKRVNNTTLWFAGSLAVIVAVFFIIHPLNPLRTKIIAADGFGYYAYLPAKFIYNDTALDFKWFDKAFFANYDPAMSPEPTSNFLVPYKNKMIDMYYPCLSFFQMPFFLAAHAAAKWFGFPPDGYSTPYQLGVGISALFYALIGLWFCSRLILRLSGDWRLSLLVPTLIFFGSSIFICTLYVGCYTHCYTFCFTAIAYYCAWHFFNRENNKWLCVLVITFCSLVILFMRPMNVLLLLGFLYFFRPFTWKQLSDSREDKKWLLALTGLLIIALLYYNLSITYTQAQTFFVNTYSAFHFYFNRWDHVWDNLAGFHHGLLWYAPLAILCMIPVFFIPRQPRLIWLLIPFAAIIILCGFWWYWKVILRTLADLTVIMSILLMHLLLRFNWQTRAGKIVLAACLLCVPVYLLKDYQLRAGILNGFNTYSDYYFRYFFRLRPASVFPIDPKTITERQGYFYNFETGSDYYITEKNKFGGRRSATLNERIDFACTHTYPLPFVKQEFKKVRVSFVYYRGEAFNDLRMVMLFRRKDSTLVDKTVYVDAGNSIAGKWDYMEFGAWVPDNVREGDVFSVYFWNPGKQNEIFIDDLEVEFVVTDGSDEMVL